MSQVFRTSDRKTQKRRRIISNIDESSTPYKKSSANRYNISLSRIETASSSSDDKIKTRFQSHARSKRIETASSSSDGKIDARFQPARKRLKGYVKSSKKVTKRKRIADRSKNIDNEWETEEFINESAIELRTSTPKRSDIELSARCNLFDDPSTPEKVRDVPLADVLLLHKSPVLRSSRRLRHLIAKDDITIQRNELLPVHLPESAKMREEEKICQEETDEDSPKLHYEENARTYLRNNTSEKDSPEWWRTKNALLRLRFPTATNDMLWDEFVEKQDDISQYLASPSARVPIKLTDSQRGLPELPGLESDSTSPGMITTGRWYFDRNTRKWISCEKRRESEQENEPGTSGRQKTRTHKNKMKRQKRKATKRRSARRQDIDVRASIYEQFSETDNEFGDVGGRRMSLRQFCSHQKAEKTALDPNESCRANAQ